MVRRRGLAVWAAVFAVAAACGGRASQNDAPGAAGTGGDRAGGGDLGRAGTGGSRSEGAGGYRAGADSGGVPSGGPASAGATAAGERGLEGQAGAGGAQGGAPFVAGAGGVGGEPAFGVGDINADGCVDLHDWVILERDYGCSVSVCGDERADIDKDGWIYVFDDLALRQHWYEGESCRPFCQSPGEGGGGAGGASAEELAPTDLTGDDCIGWDELALFAGSYGCDTTCAAPSMDVVRDGCVDERDLDAWIDAAEQDDWCEDESRRTVSERRTSNSATQ